MSPQTSRRAAARPESNSLLGCSRMTESNARLTCTAAIFWEMTPVTCVALNLLLFHCEFASSFWRSLGYELAPELMVADAHRMPQPESVPANHFDTFTLLYCWQLWKGRNGFVFRGETMGLRQTLHACRSAARTWSCRLPITDRPLGDQWCNLFSLAM